MNESHNSSTPNVFSKLLDKIPDFDAKEKKVNPICLPCFSSFYLTDEFSKIPEQEELLSIENITTSFTDASIFYALQYIYNNTQFLSVRMKITSYYLENMNKIYRIIKKTSIDTQRRPAIGYFGFASSSRSFNDFCKAFDSSDDEDQTQTKEPFHGLVDTLPDLYRRSDIDTIKQINKSLTKMLATLSPNHYQYTNNALYSFRYFKMTINCILDIINLFHQNIISPEAARHLSQNIIVTAFSIQNDAAYVVRLAEMKSEYGQQYLLNLLPLISKMASAIQPEELGLLQQFFISVVMQCGDITMYTEYQLHIQEIANLTPPLLKTSGKFGYKEACHNIDNLYNIVKTRIYQSPEDFATIFNQICPAVPVKIISAMNPSESLLLLSIAVLEKARASCCSFAPFFDYFEQVYNPTFSSCLDDLSQTIFQIFQRSLILSKNEDKKRAAIVALMERIFNNYFGKNPKVIQLIDFLIPKVTAIQGTSFFSTRYVSALLNAIEKSTQIGINPQRTASFKALIRPIIEKALNFGRTFVFALIQNYFILRSCNSFVYTYNFSFFSVVSEFSPKFQNVFVNEYSMKMAIYSCIKHNTAIENVEDQNERIIYFAFTLKSVDDIDNLLQHGKMNVLISAWSHVVMCVPQFSFQFVLNLVNRFITSIKLGRGLFSSLYEPEEIDFQGTTLVFCQKLLSIRLYTREVLNIISTMATGELTNSVGSVPALFKLANFLIAVLTSDLIELSSSVTHDASIVFITTIMKIISFKTAPSVFKYVRIRELITLKDIINICSSIVKKINFNNSNASILKGETKLREVILSHQKRNMKSQQFDLTLYKNLFDLMTYSLCHMNSLFFTFLMPTENQDEANALLSNHYIRPRHYHLNDLMPLFWEYCPSSLWSLGESLLENDQISNFIAESAQTFPYHLAFDTHLALTLAKLKIDDLSICALLNPADAMILLNPEVMSHPLVSQYLIRCIEQFELDEIIQYIPQLTQSLRFDKLRRLMKFLKHFSISHPIFAHYLLWNISYEKCRSNSTTDKLPLILVELEGKIKMKMTQEQTNHFEEEFEFINKLDQISQKLLEQPPEQRKESLQLLLGSLDIQPGNLFVPTNPNYKIIEIDSKNSLTLKSHAKVPILVKFFVYDENEYRLNGTKNRIRSACIFKIQDDVRMDSMMIQFIDKFKHIFEDVGIEFYLNPYRVFATGQERGVIELIADSKSRHSIGTEFPEDLLLYFIHKYGQIGTKGFDEAQRNFIKSMAPYSLICYLFQVKDRHNANIMIDEEGHVVHIDFGFIFDISPGGNIKFERAPFKLTNEMIAAMGGQESQSFRLFVALFTKCFVAARARYDEIEAIGALMSNAGFPCFTKNSFMNLRQRFMVDKPASEIMPMMEHIIADSINAMTTTAYDMFQFSQNKIFYV